MNIPQDAVPKLILDYKGAVLTTIASGEPATICCDDSSGTTAESSKGEQLHSIFARFIKHWLDVQICILHHTVKITPVQHWNAQSSCQSVVIPSMDMSRERSG